MGAHEEDQGSATGTGAAALYAAFDRYPSTKGAAIHIREFAGTLFSATGGGVLHVLGGDDLPAYQREESATGDIVEIVRFVDEVPNLLDRVAAYGAQLHAVATTAAPHLRIAQVRDPWSAAPLVEHGLAGRGTPARLVFEVNGLPSIELPYRYPTIAGGTLDKIRAVEARCLAAADAVVTPSHVLADRLIQLGVPSGVITVIPNGATLPDAPLPRPPSAPDRYLVYVGALQPWQGVDALLAALARLADLDDLRLVVCSATPAKRAKGLRRLAERLGVAERVEWRYKVPHREVAAWLAHAELSVAPLSDCARNVDQGCCPLKVLESMAVGTCVVASDLAVTRELVEDGRHGVLVAPGRPAELARAIRVALEYPDHTAELGRNGQARVADAFTWTRSRNALAALHHDLLR